MEKAPRARSEADPGGQGPAAAGSRLSVRYVGVADWWGRRVWVEQDDVRSGLRYRSGAVIEFAWGRAGLGARELACAILDHAVGATGVQEHLYGSFVHDVIARLPESGFELDRQDVLDWLGLQR